MSEGNAVRQGSSGICLFPVPQKYDPEEFMISSTDGKGHSEKFWFRGPTGIQRQVEIIMANHKFPYKTSSDLLRHALVRHLYWLQTLEPDMESVMSQVQVVIELMKEEQYHQDFESVFEEMGKTVSRYVGSGHTGEALRTVNRCREVFEKMPEGFWRDQYLNELTKRFGYLYSGEGVMLGGGDENG